MRSYAGQQEVDWTEVWYPPMPGLNPMRIPPMRCALGLEPTPEAYIGHLVLCFREVARVLREDGVAWVVMGDSYASPGNKRSGEGETRNLSTEKFHGGTAHLEQRRTTAYTPNLQQGDLMLIPHRLALALQADGWIVRNDAVWHKKAPMPESVSGWRWERCRVKVRSLADRTHETSHRDYSSHLSSVPATEWHPCPGCDKCSSTGGYVLRRGSWRHTRAHETVLMLA